MSIWRNLSIPTANADIIYVKKASPPTILPASALLPIIAPKLNAPMPKSNVIPKISMLD